MYIYSWTVSFTATVGCRLFCSALPVRSAHSSSPEVGNGLIDLARTAVHMLVIARHSQHKRGSTTQLFNVRAQCWWATTCGCRDEESNPGPPGSEKSALPLGRCPPLPCKDWFKQKAAMYRRTGECCKLLYRGLERNLRRWRLWYILD